MRFIFIIALFATLAVPLPAQDFDKGLLAAQRGDFATALKVWRPLAKEGDPVAQKNLALIYYYGEGVAQDTILAYMWFNFSAANGNENGEQLKDFVEKQMTSQEIEKAKVMARVCMESNYQNCGN